MSLLTLIIWAVVGWLLGILGFILLPIVAGATAPKQWASKVADWYFNLSMSSFERVLCSISAHNDSELVRVTWNNENKTENTTMDGEDHDYQDPRGKLMRCFNAPWNIVLSDVQKIIQPIDAEAGKAKKRRDENGRKWLSMETDGGEEQPSVSRAINAHVAIPPGIRALNMQHARYLIPEAHEPNDSQKTEENVEKSQQGFKSHNVISMIIIIMTVGSAAALAWFIWSNTGGGESGSSIEIPLMMIKGFL